MWLLGLFLSSLVCLSVGAELTEENGVFVLTDANFAETIAKHDFVMVFFYAPWCGHCNAFKPSYEEAANLLKDNPRVILAKVDATESKELANQYQITGYPTVKLFRHTVPVEFHAERDAASVVAWINRKLEPAVRKLESADEVKALIDSEKLLIVVFVKSENPEITALFTEIADSDKATVGISSSAEARKEYGITEDVKVVLFKKVDDNRVDYNGKLIKDDVQQFLMTESVPLVVDFDPHSSSDVFSSPIKRHLVAFAEKPHTYDPLKNTLLTVAKQFKGKMHFVIIDISEPDNLRILEFFGMTKEEVPGCRVIYLQEDMTKFKPESSDMSEEAIVKFADSVLSGSMKPFFMSQEIPPESDDAVTVLVGKNFNEFAHDKSKAVFAFLHAPWCGHCKQLGPIWDQLGENYKGRQDIAIVKMDATANEAENLKVHSFPTLKYFAKDSDTVIEYTGERTLEAMIKFIESGGKAMEADKPAPEGAADDEEKRDEL